MSFVRAASSVSGLTLVSRILGLLRDSLSYHVLGTGWANATFVLAWMVPNLLRRLFGEGALAAAFVPAFTRTLQRDGLARARRLLAGVSGAVIAVLGAVSGLVVVASFVVPPEIFGLGTDAATGAVTDAETAGAATAGAGTAERGALLWDLLAMLFPYAIPVCLLAIYAGALNGLGVFAPPASAPAVLNLFWIGGLGVAIWAGAGDLADITRIVAAAILVGGFAQLLLVVVPLRRRDCLPAPRLPRRDESATAAVFRAMAPTVLGLSLVQVNVVLDQVLTEYLVGPGTANHIYLANRLVLFPHALVALPLATTVFPRLASEAMRADRGAMRSTLDQAIGVTLFLAVPAAVGMILLAQDLIEVVFEHGLYTASDTAVTRWTTITLVAGLPALGAAQLYARALYAIDETGTPARIAGWLVLLNLALNLGFVLGLGLGVAGFTTATSCCTVCNAVALRHALDRRAPQSRAGLPWRAALRVAVATAAMAVAVGWLRDALPADSRAMKALLHLVVPVAAGILVYGSVQALMRSPELHALFRRLAR